MEQLIKTWNENGKNFICLTPCETKCQNDGVSSCMCDTNLKVWKRLSAYEDTGLEPEEIKSLWAEWKVNLSCLNSYRELGDISHLRDLISAEKENRLVVLPCKVGTPVWSDDILTKRRISEGHITAFTVAEDGVWSFWAAFDPIASSVEFILDDIGKTVFLTHEEVEAKLRGEEYE